jgi:hypothetical protein
MNRHVKSSGVGCGHRQVPATLRALIDMIRTNRAKPGKSLLKNPFTKF